MAKGLIIPYNYDDFRNDIGANNCAGVSYIIDNMILAGIISGYAVTQTIAGAERTQATGIGSEA